VKVAYQTGLSPENIMPGFWSSGRFPLDREVFTDEDFVGSYVTTDQPQAEQAISDRTKSVIVLVATEAEVLENDAAYVTGATL
jgi:hypothetical protein